MRRVLAATIVGLLAAGTAFAGKVETDFNPKADFPKFETWSWVPGHDEGHKGILAGAAARSMLEEALTVQLERAGLRKAGSGETPDLVVRYWGDIADAAAGTSTGYLGGYEPYMAGDWGVMFSTSVRFSEKSATLIIDLIEPSTKVLAWRAFIEQKYGSPSQTGTPVADALRKAFDRYPPSESARARKLREWEKREAAK